MKKEFPFLYILIVFLIAFLPLTSFLFALKNDMFIGYFPPKYLMGEALQSQQLPLWNPYISFGLPFYGDMSGSYWNPITWLIAYTTGYNAYTLTLEVMLYIILSGAGMYKLSGCYTKNKYIRLIAAVAYMCNGYIVGHLQHINWLSGAAFLPFCVWALLNMYRSADLKSVSLAVVFNYLLIASSHPGIIIGAIYFLVLFVLFILFRSYQENGPKGLVKHLKINILFAVALLLLSAGLIAGYLDILPHFVRKEKVDISLSLSENTTINSWLSFLLPFATTKNRSFFNNDIAFRNCYIGITMFLFLIISFLSAQTKEQRFYLFTGLGFLLLSIGSSIKLYAIKILPLIGFVRVNAEFRIFSILCFILLSVIYFEKYISSKKIEWGKTRLLLYSLIVIFVILFFFSLFKIISTKEGFVYSMDGHGFAENPRLFLKEFTDKISFYDALMIQSFVQVLLLLLLFSAIKRMNLKRIFLFTVIDVIIATLLNLPFTGVGKASVSEIAAIHQKSPGGIPIPVLQPLLNNDTITANEASLVGEWSYYNKQPGTPTMVLYPVKLINNYTFYNELKKDSSISVASLPLFFLSNNITGSKLIKSGNLENKNILSYKVNEIELSFYSNTTCSLVFLQNYYPHWYYQKNSKVYPVQKAGVSFIGIPVEKGVNKIKIFFRPTVVTRLLILSTCTLILFLLLLFIPGFNKKILK